VSPAASPVYSHHRSHLQIRLHNHLRCRRVNHQEFQRVCQLHSRVRHQRRSHQTVLQDNQVAAHLVRRHWNLQASLPRYPPRSRVTNQLQIRPQYQVSSLPVNQRGRLHHNLVVSHHCSLLVCQQVSLLRSLLISQQGNHQANRQAHLPSSLQLNLRVSLPSFLPRSRLHSRRLSPQHNQHRLRQLNPHQYRQHSRHRCHQRVLLASPPQCRRLTSRL
jgi:hypothetical protein